MNVENKDEGFQFAVHLSFLFPCLYNRLEEVEEEHS